MFETGYCSLFNPLFKKLRTASNTFGLYWYMQGTVQFLGANPQQMFADDYPELCSECR